METYEGHQDVGGGHVDGAPTSPRASVQILCSLQMCLRTALWGCQRQSKGRHRTSRIVGAQEKGRVAVVTAFSCIRQSWREARQETETQAKCGQRPEPDTRGFPLRFLGN